MSKGLMMGLGLKADHSCHADEGCQEVGHMAQKMAAVEDRVR